MKLKLYRWKGKNQLKQTQKGMLVAENEEQARQILFSRGLQHLRLQQNWQLSSKPSNAEVCDLLQQLTTLLSAAVPLKNSLQILLQNCVNIQLNQWLRRCIADIESGMPFSQAIANQGRFFSAQEQQLIKVGEMTGKLALVCSQIAEYKQQALALQRKLQKILLYPMLVLGISLILTALLLIFIVPQFADMYVNRQAELPVFTAFLLSLSHGLQEYFWQILLLSALTIVLVKNQLRRSPKLQQVKAQLISNTPIFGNIVALSRLVGFCRSLQVMLQSGVPLNQGLQSFLPSQSHRRTLVQGDLTLIQEVENMLHWLTQGYAFSAAVGTGLFPMQAQQMLQVGEQSGQLSLMLKHIANTYQQQLEHQIDLLSQMLEPLLMLIIGGIIGVIMLGLYLPIFNLGSLIQ